MSKRAIFIVTFALLLSNAMGGLDNTSVNTALPAIISDLHGIQLIGWVMGVFLLGTAISTPLWSKLGEHIGNKGAYQWAAFLFILGSFLQGMAPSMLFLIAARTIQGIGNGGMVSLPYIIYAKMYKNPRKRMQVLGFVSASFSTATIIGPLVGGYIVDSFSWHWIFYINVPIGLISVVLVQIFYKSTPNRIHAKQVDYYGAALMTMAIVALLGAIEIVGKANPWLVGGLFLITLVLVVLLIKVESSAEDPIIPGRLFKNRPLVIDFVLFTLIWAAFISFNIYGPMWAQGILATTALIGGATQIPASVTDFLGSGLVAPGRRFMSPQQVIMLGVITIVIGFGMLVLAGIKAPYWLILTAGAFEGFGQGMCFNELQIKVQQDADPVDVPVATSFSFLIRMLSQAFAAAIFGIILNRAIARGVSQFHSITVKMMNQLSDSTKVHLLPTSLIPDMRRIMFNGLHNIFLLSFVLMIISLVINLWGLHLEKVKFAKQKSDAD